MNLSDALHIALPEAFLAVAALVLLLVGAYAKKSMTLVSALAGVALLIAAALSANSAVGVVFNGAYIADKAAAFAKVFIYGFSAIAVLLGDGWLKRLDNQSFEYPILIVIAALGMGMMASAGDLISLYIGIELHSLALYVLAAFRRDDARSSEAGLKYFVLGALSSGLLLYGASLIYGFAGSTRFDVIAHAVQAGAGGGVLFGLVFLICGLAFKISAAPFHMWTPDVYEGAPTPVVMFITTAPKLAAMVLTARVLVDAFGGAVEQWRQVVLAIAMISVMVGAFAGLVQKNLKRLIAYSSIANIGYALIGLPRLPDGAEARRQADGDPGRHLRPVPGQAGHGPGADGPVLLFPRPAAVLGLLGQVLRVPGGPGRRRVAGGRGRSGVQRGGGLLLPAHRQGDVVRRAGRRGRQGAPGRQVRGLRPGHLLSPTGRVRPGRPPVRGPGRRGRPGEVSPASPGKSESPPRTPRTPRARCFLDVLGELGGSNSFSGCAGRRDLD
jgi:hypothetical protein